MASQWEHIKKVPNTNFIVDGFKFQTPKCRHYWLTHSHSDHTIGLYPTFNSGTIYCSHITANFCIKDLRIPPSCIRPLPLDTPVIVDGINVTLIDANHCPGAVLLLFRVPAPPGSEHSTQNILHTGDMRWHARMGQHPALRTRRIDLLFLDTTYASPQHVFPSQEEAIATIVRLMRAQAERHPATLFVVGSYRIGKERAYLGAAKALGWQVYVNPDKLRVLKLLGLPERDMALITKDKEAARIHVTFMGKGLQPDALKQRLEDGRHTHIVGFRPTGWSFRKSGLDVRREGPVTVYGVPYSEHSSFAELRDCVRTLRPRKIVPTVNATNPAAARLLVDRFADLMDLSKDRSRLDFFLRKAHTAPPGVSPSPPEQANCAAAAEPPSLPAQAPPGPNRGRRLQHAASAPDQAAAASATRAVPAPDEEEEVDGHEGGEGREDDAGDDDAVLAAGEAAWQRAVLAEERMLGGGDEDDLAVEAKGAAAEENWQDGGCSEAGNEGEWCEGNKACVACSQEEPSAAEGTGRGGKRGAEHACGGREACSGRPAASEEEVVRWCSGVSSSSGEGGQPWGSRVGDGQGAAKRAKRARTAAELVHLGLDSPPAAATRPAAARRPEVLEIASSSSRAESKGSYGSILQSGQVIAPPHASGVQEVQQQERIGMPSQHCPIKYERQGSADSWDSVEDGPPAVKAEQGALLQELPGCMPRVEDPAVEQKQEPAGQSAKAEPGSGEAAGEVVDLAGVDVAEQARILRGIAASRKVLQRPKGGACAARGSGACQASLKAFFKALPPGGGE